MKGVLDRSDAAVSRGSGTIEHVEQLSARNSHIQGSARCIESQIKMVHDIVNQIQSSITDESANKLKQ